MTTLCDELKLSQPVVSNQLARLKMNRLVTRRREGQRVIYSLANGSGTRKGDLLHLADEGFSIHVCRQASDSS